MTELGQSQMETASVSSCHSRFCFSLTRLSSSHSDHTMADTIIFVTVGREKLEINASGDMTFGELRRVIEGRTGSVDGGLRLVHKGTSFPDTKTLCSAGVKSRTNMMALRTKKQIDARKDMEKREKLKRDQDSAVAMKERTRTKDTGSSSESPRPLKQVVLGDDPVDGQTSVILIKGRSKFRVNIDLSKSVASLKEKASVLDGMNGQPRDMKLLFKGKYLDDAKPLSEYDAKDGVSMMLLFSARHHDAKEDFAEVGRIEQKVAELEGKVRGLLSKVNHRFLDDVEKRIARGELEEESLRYKDNIGSVKSDDRRKPEIEAKLSEIAAMLDSVK